MTFDSEEFWGLDEEILGDGTSDSSTRSLSEAVERRFDANNKYLKSRDWKVTMNPFTKNPDNVVTDADGYPTNARRLASHFSSWGKLRENSERSGFIPMGQYILTIPVWIHPDTTEFRITMRGDVVCPRELKDGNSAYKKNVVFKEPENPRGKSVQATAYLCRGHYTSHGELGEKIGRTSELWTTDDNPVHRISVSPDLDIQDVDGVAATLQLSIWSNPSKESQSAALDILFDEGTTSEQTELWQNHIFNTSFDSNDGTKVDSFIDQISDDLSFTLSLANNKGNGFYKIRRASKADDKINIEARDTDRQLEGPLEQVDGTPAEALLFYTNSIVPKSWTVESFSDKTSSARRYSEKISGSMLAQEVVSGTDISNQAQNLDYNYRKPRLKAFGPKGERGATVGVEVPWDQGYSDVVNLRWKYLSFDNASSTHSSTNEVDRLTFRSDKGRCKIKIITHYALVSYWKVPFTVFSPIDGSPAGVDSHIGMATPSSPSISDITMESGVDLDFTYNLKQRGSSATNEIVASKTSTEDNQTIYISNIRNRYPLLRTLYEAFWTDPDAPDTSYAGDDFNANINQVFGEGWLDRSDASSIVEKAEADIILPQDATTDRDRPFEAEWFLSNTANITAEYENAAGTTFQHPEDRIALVTLQTAIYEEQA